MFKCQYKIKKGDVKKLRSARKETKTHIAGITNAVVRIRLKSKKLDFS